PRGGPPGLRRRSGRPPRDRHRLVGPLGPDWGIVVVVVPCSDGAPPPLTVVVGAGADEPVVVSRPPDRVVVGGDVVVGSVAVVGTVVGTVVGSVTVERVGRLVGTGRRARGR